MASYSTGAFAQDWNTPPELVQAVEEFFGTVDLDPCSNHFSLVQATRRIILPEDGLQASWQGAERIFINPPYGRDKARGTTIKDWCKKAVEEHEATGAEVVLLVPVAPNTSHWKTYVFPKAAAVCFLILSAPRFRFLQGESCRPREHS